MVPRQDSETARARSDTMVEDDQEVIICEGPYEIIEENSAEDEIKDAYNKNVQDIEED